MFSVDEIYASEWLKRLTANADIAKVLGSVRVSEVFRKNKKGRVIIPDDNIT